MRDLADSWDATLGRIDSFAGSPARLSLEGSEIASQERLLNIIEAAHEPSIEMIALVKEEARCVGTLFRQYMPLYCFAYLSSG